MSTDNLEPEFTDALQMGLRNMNTIQRYFMKRTWALPLMVEGVAINHQPRQWEEIVEQRPHWVDAEYFQKRIFIEHVKLAAMASKRGPALLRICQVERYADIVIFWLAVLLNIYPGASAVWLDSERIEFKPGNLAVELRFGNYYSRKSLDIAKRIFEHAPTQQQH